MEIMHVEVCLLVPVSPKTISGDFQSRTIFCHRRSTIENLSSDWLEAGFHTHIMSDL